MAAALLLLIIALSTSLLLLSAAATTPSSPPPIGLGNCTTTCGDVQVPYPFGLGPPVATKILSGGLRPTAAGPEVPVVLYWVVPVHDEPVDNLTCSKKTARSLCRSRQTRCFNILGGSFCGCESGYEGNPYIEDGCQG